MPEIGVGIQLSDWGHAEIIKIYVETGARALGHKDINTTLIYTQIVSFESNEFIPRRAKSREEEDALIKAGFEFVRYNHANREAIYRKLK